MAYWNPFGWSEETRRSIQSVVRPVMQVASMAASMGAFSGGGGAAKAGTGTTDGAAQAAAGIGDVGPSFETGIDLSTDFGTSYGADALNPNNPAFTDMPTGSLEMSGDFNQQAARNFPQPTQLQTNPFDSTGSQFNQPNWGIDPNATGLGGPNSGLPMQGMENGQPIQVQPYQEGQVVGEADFAKAMENQPEIQQRMTEMNKATEGMSYDEKLKMVQEGKMPTGTQQPTQPAPKPKPTEPPKDKTEGPGPGGKEEKWSWDGKAFNWENIEKFLKSKEGLHWLLMDEKGFAGIGRKLSAAADAGVSGAGGLTPEERKKILKRLKKEREEKKKERR